MKRFIFVLCLIAILTSCSLSSYSVQVFTGDNVVTADTYTVEKTTTTDKGINVENIEKDAIFEGRTLDEAYKKAHEAGYTNILSIETFSYTMLFPFPIPLPKVIIRCSEKADPAAEEDTTLIDLSVIEEDNISEVAE